jgi:hypothetical protein
MGCESGEFEAQKIKNIAAGLSIASAKALPQLGGWRAQVF